MMCSTKLGTEMRYKALLAGECGSAQFSLGTGGGWGKE